MRKVAAYNDCVFINCPFDDQYKPLLWAIIYAVYRCGFFPQTALDEDDGSVNRLNKIVKKIKDCRYGIHDLSRIQLNNAGYPRFNMPFEAGIFFGAKNLGDRTQKTKNALVLEKKKFTYQQYISDLNGIDTKAHNNNASDVMKKIRDWLRTSSGRTTLPGYNHLDEDYKKFKKNLPGIVAKLGFKISTLPFTEYCTIVEEAVLKQI